MKKYTTAEAFALVASGEREEMRAQETDELPEQRFKNAIDRTRHEYREPGTNNWFASGLIPARTDYYDPNDAEEPATEPEWRECSKAFALRNPNESQARVWTEGHCWGKWGLILDGDRMDDVTVFDFRTFAPIPSGYLCEVPEGTRAIEVRITDARGRESSSGTIPVSGQAGVVRVETGHE